MRPVLGLLAVLAVSLIALPRPADASERLRPYIGLDAGTLNFNYKKSTDRLLEKSLTGIGVHLGTRLNERFSVEIAYARATGNAKTARLGDAELRLLPGANPAEHEAFSETKNLKVEGFGLDGFIHFPLGAGRADGLLTLGVLRATSEHQAAVRLENKSGDRPLPRYPEQKVKESDIVLRLGAGAQLRLNPRLSVRALVRHYPSGDFDDRVESAWDATLGLNFSF